MGAKESNLCNYMYGESSVAYLIAVRKSIKVNISGAFKTRYLVENCNMMPLSWPVSCFPESILKLKSNVRVSLIIASCPVGLLQYITPWFVMQKNLLYQSEYLLDHLPQSVPQRAQRFSENLPPALFFNMHSLYLRRSP